MHKKSLQQIFILLILLSASNVEVKAQKKLWNDPAAYINQKQPGDTPVIFADKILVPDSGIAMDRCAFSNDGMEFYYCSAQHWFNTKGNKICFLKYDGKKWQGPFDLNYGYYAPTFSIDYNSMYFLGGKPDSTMAQVWIARRTKDGWGSPEIYLKEKYGLYDFMPTLSGTYYVASNAHQGNRKDYQTYDFCSLTFKDNDTVVKSLGTVINTPKFDGDFYVSRDESYMIISYKEKPDYECELAITFRMADNSWSTPENLGKLINNGDAHRWGEYVSPDGKFLFYSMGTSEKDCHLYWVRFDLLKEKLRRNIMYL